MRTWRADTLPGIERGAPLSGRFLQTGVYADVRPARGKTMALTQEIDFGTPAGTGEALVTLEVDGKPLTVASGTSVMRAAMEAGIQVPKLCATDNMKAFGSCRLCLVEIDGRRGTPASC